MKARLRTQKTTVFDNTIITPAEAQAFIDAHDTETSSSMAQVQQDAVCGFVLRLKGAATPNGNDLWSKFDTAGTRIWPLTPIDDSTANADAYGMELLTAASLGTFTNFVSDDFQPTGVTGDDTATKIFLCGRAPSDYPFDDLGFGAYIVNRNPTGPLMCGCDGGSTANQQALRDDLDLTEDLVRIQEGGATQTGLTARATTGFKYGQRTGNTLESYMDGVLVYSDGASVPSSSRTTAEFGFHAFNRVGTTLGGSDNTLGLYVYGTPYLTAEELEDFYAAIDWYQDNVITGGRTEAQFRIEQLELIAASDMDSTQQLAIEGLISRLEGTGTTNGSDLWTKFKEADSRIWVHTPIDDSTASAALYNFEFITGDTIGTFTNFVPGDFTSEGVAGGATKVFNTGINLDTYPQDNQAHGVWIDERLDSGTNTIRAGGDSGGGTSQVLLQSQDNLTDVVYRVSTNFAATDTIGSVQTDGLHIIDRGSATTNEYYIDGSQVSSLAANSVALGAQPMGFHAYLRSGSILASPTSDRLSAYFQGLPSLSAAEHVDLYDAISWYQANVITGGR